MHVHRPGPTIKLRSASPRTAGWAVHCLVLALVASSQLETWSGWAVGLVGQRVTTQAARSDHPLE